MNGGYIPYPTRTEGQTNSEYYDEIRKYHDRVSLLYIKKIRKSSSQRPVTEFPPREDWQAKYDRR